MRLPDQSPPVYRNMDQGLNRRLSATPMNVIQASCVDRLAGVSPAGYEECLAKQGLARELCLMSFE